VANPRRIIASYSLSEAVRNCAKRVARPTRTTSTPVANGSSVPEWPMRRSCRMCRTRPTTSCEVMPSGLSIIRTPSTDRIVDVLVLRKNTQVYAARNGLKKAAEAYARRDAQAHLRARRQIVGSETEIRFGVARTAASRSRYEQVDG